MFSLDTDRDSRLRSEMARRSVTKKSLTELADSGVSLFSEGSSVARNRHLQALRKSNDKVPEIKHKPQLPSFGLHSESLEKPNPIMYNKPAHPFVSDPSMPPLPGPNTVRT